MCGFCEEYNASKECEANNDIQFNYYAKLCTKGIYKGKEKGELNSRCHLLNYCPECGIKLNKSDIKRRTNMILSETIEMMNSTDYKERFKVEYMQLKIRMNGLSAILEKYKAGTLTFTPSCSFDLLNGQLKAMDLYASYLEDRAIIENIEL